jgi:APA family basic amino acid/polyamine antiporter
LGTLRAIFAPLVAVLAASILLTATNAGLLGISRLTYNFSAHKQLPMVLGRVHPRFRTPYIAIILFCFIAIVMLVPGFSSPGFFADLGALYVFGSLLCFSLAHAAILSLRIKKPEMPRPFKLGWNIRIKRKELPLIVILGLLSNTGIWIVVIVTQPFSRWMGLAWMTGGILLYYLYRRVRRRAPDWQVEREKQPRL